MDFRKIAAFEISFVFEIDFLLVSMTLYKMFENKQFWTVFFQLPVYYMLYTDRICVNHDHKSTL